MIDYEKLAKAYELAHKAAKQSGGRADIVLALYGDDEPVFLFYDYANPGNDYDSVSLNFVIEHLESLTKPEPKYKVADFVWMLLDNHVRCRVVFESVFDYEDGWSYKLDGDLELRDEDELFLTPQALIEHQIAYWTCLKSDEKSTCSDDVSMTSSHINDSVRYLTPPFEGEIKGFESESSELNLVSVVSKCPDCGNDMAHYAELDMNGKWMTGCSKRCGYYAELYK